jgi:hypothetical protein
MKEKNSIDEAIRKLDRIIERYELQLPGKSLFIIQTQKTVKKKISNRSK